MVSKLIFKKAFGIRSLPIDDVLWITELGCDKYKFKSREKYFEISVGKFGINEKEKYALSLFYHADERQLTNISEIPTIDISFNIDVKIPKDISKKWEEYSIANSLVETYIPDAFYALRRFINSYRDIKYLAYRDSNYWTKNEILILKYITEVDFNTFLFYNLIRNKKIYIGGFSVGESKISIPFDNTQKGEFRKALKKDVPLERNLIIKAWDYYFQEDFRSALISSAIAIELVLSKLIRKHFSEKSVASSSKINKFIARTSNRLLCTIILGLMGLKDNKWREDIANIFEIRNGLVHGQRKDVSKNDTEKALSKADEVLKIFENY